MLKELYDQDVLVEEALLTWADEKASAGAEDTVFLRKVWPCCAPAVPILLSAPSLNSSRSRLTELMTGLRNCRRL